MYTTTTNKLWATLSWHGPDKCCQRLTKKLNILILALLICVPGLAFSLSTVVIKSVDLLADEAGQETASFTVTRTDDGNLIALNVPLSFSGTAGLGPDYTLSNTICCESALIPAGLLSTTITLTPVLDNNVEGTETAVIFLVAHSSYELGNDTEVEIEIADDVAVVTLVVDDDEASEAGPGTGRFTVFRTNNGNIAAAISVPLDFSGTAGHGPDYTLSNVNCCITVVIPPGDLSATVDLIPVFDNNVEGTETAIITLGSHTSYELGVDIEAVIQITDDVAVVSMEIVDSEASEAGPGTGSFTVFRSNNGNIAAGITLPLVFSGTASHGSDYTLSNVKCCYTVTIPAGDLSTNVILTPVLDTNEEGDEIAEISLGTGNSYLLGDPSKVSIIIADFTEGIFSDSFEE